MVDHVQCSDCVTNSSVVDFVGWSRFESVVLADAELSEKCIWSTQISVDRPTVQVADLGGWWWVLIFRWCVKLFSDNL